MGYSEDHDDRRKHHYRRRVPDDMGRGVNTRRGITELHPTQEKERSAKPKRDRCPFTPLLIRGNSRGGKDRSDHDQRAKSAAVVVDTVRFAIDIPGHHVGRPRCQRDDAGRHKQSDQSSRSSAHPSHAVTDRLRFASADRPTRTDQELRVFGGGPFVSTCPQLCGTLQKGSRRYSANESIFHVL